MRDKKDNATLELPGLCEAVPLPRTFPEPARTARPRAARPSLRQEQLQLLEETDAAGLPVWRRDDNLGLTGPPIWAKS